MLETTLSLKSNRKMLKVLLENCLKENCLKTKEVIFASKVIGLNRSFVPINICHLNFRP